MTDETNVGKVQILKGRIDHGCFINENNHNLSLEFFLRDYEGMPIEIIIKAFREEIE